jgi:hypothetical protein
MKIITNNVSYDNFPEVCKANDAFGIYCCWPDADREELIKAAPCLGWIPLKDHWCAIFLFNTLDEMMDVYRTVIGDDGPTIQNPYKGPVKVYALTCSPGGSLLTENT